MTILTDELIEKAARAAYARQYPGGVYGYTALSDDFKENACAALSAILPDIIEECAQQVIRAQYKEDAVAFIRELATKENENG